MAQLKNEFFKRAALICDMFPNVGFLDIAQILYEDSCVNRETERAFSLESEAEHPAPATVEAPAEPPKNEMRAHRKQSVRVTIDGHTYIAPNRYDMLVQIGLRESYHKLYHAGNKTRNITEEAEALAQEVKCKLGSDCTEYYAYGFDGKIYRATLEVTRVSRIDEVKIVNCRWIVPADLEDEA